MLNLTILAIGKLKESHYKSAFEEYLKRLKPYAKIKVEELKAEPFNESTKSRAKEAEGARLMDYLEKFPDSQVMVMDELGKEFTSQEFAGYLDSIRQPGILVIGGSLGLSRTLLDRYENKIALSKMTLPHELARVVLAEQLYRAVTILKGKEYHY